MATRGKRATAPLQRSASGMMKNSGFHDGAILKYATEDGDARDARDGTSETKHGTRLAMQCVAARSTYVTKWKRSGAENTDSLRRNNEKKRHVLPFL